MDAPQHAFELRLKIGANTWEYALHALDELAAHIRECGPNCGTCSGGWDGSYSVDIQRREVSPDDYRAELENWRNG